MERLQPPSPSATGRVAPTASSFTAEVPAASMGMPSRRERETLVRAIRCSSATRLARVSWSGSTSRRSPISSTRSHVMPSKSPFSAAMRSARRIRSALATSARLVWGTAPRSVSNACWAAAVASRAVTVATASLESAHTCTVRAICRRAEASSWPPSPSATPSAEPSTAGLPSAEPPSAAPSPEPPPNSPMAALNPTTSGLSRPEQSRRGAHTTAARTATPSMPFICR